MTDQNELIEQKSWWNRNWKWVVPVGGCLTLIILFIAFLATVIFGATKMMSGSEPYQDSLTKAQQNEQVIELLGEPIETVGIMQGSISFSNNDGDADIRIPIKGPNGEGIIYVVAEKRNDVWTYSEQEVRIDQNNEVIDLLNEGLDQEDEEEY
ncbi:cytochrome c oxidase assembly factor Coa1 family protein [Dokdonia ponticola]|uniref:Cytochrome c oxidase assembly factor Coa1 family protein n=1 Tax=Dokdonia ponticola TaxID=2041041 RepID=A0ABV9I0Z4_9FLAO